MGWVKYRQTQMLG